MDLLKQRLARVGFVVVLAVAVAVGVAMLGTVMQAKPNAIPVGLVVLDQGAVGPGGSKLQLGDTIKQKLLGTAGTPVKWHVYGSEKEAMDALDQQVDYGALVLPEQLSAGFGALAAGSGQPIPIPILISEGKNAEVAGNVKQVLHQVIDGMGRELTAQLLEQMGQRSPQLPIGAVKALVAPLQGADQLVHPVGEHSAGGNAPTMLTLLGWIVSMVASLFLYLAAREARRQGARGTRMVPVQLAAGLVWMAVCAPLIVWMADGWYGMEPTGGSQTWLFLWLGMSMFFLLQTMLINAVGLPALGLMVLLLFFSLPVLNLPPELLPAGTKTWLYSWTPLRFVASGLRDALYFDGVRSGVATVVWWIGGGCAVLGLATGWNARPVAAKDGGLSR